jgi:uncharacterized protein with von Willebrand factor type A (vWA) domain
LPRSAGVPCAAGLPVGPGKLIDAVEALRTVGLSRRDDFYWMLHAVLGPIWQQP